MKLEDAQKEFWEITHTVKPSREQIERGVCLANSIFGHYEVYFKKLKEGFRSFLDSLPEEYDDLHTKNLIEDARRLLDEAEEVTGI